MEPVESDKEGAPAYRLYAGAVELGAAWAKTAKESSRGTTRSGSTTPPFPAPIFANLDGRRGQRLVRADLEPAEAERDNAAARATTRAPAATERPNLSASLMSGGALIAPGPLPMRRMRTNAASRQRRATRNVWTPATGTSRRLVAPPRGGSIAACSNAAERRATCR